ncbi:MAG: isoprenylcysteine carboxylmethyltransferase family protein [Erythrobacter sp.]
MTKFSQPKVAKPIKKLYFPPLLQFMVYGIGGYIAAASFPALAYQSTSLFWASLPLGLVGIVILLISVRSFAKAGTTVNPIEPEKAEQLVTSGLYRCTRNPMYLGMLLVLLAAALAVQNIAALGGPLFFMVSITHLQIIPEERVLERTFGDAFAAYRQQTRRWL